MQAIKPHIVDTGAMAIRRKKIENRKTLLWSKHFSSVSNLVLLRLRNLHALRSDDAGVELRRHLPYEARTELLNFRLYLLILIEDAFTELIMRISPGFSLVLGPIAYDGQLRTRVADGTHALSILLQVLGTMPHVWSHGVVLHLRMVLASNKTMLSIDVGLLRVLRQMLTTHLTEWLLHLDSVVVQPLAVQNGSVRLMLRVQLEFNWVRLGSATSCG